ncbi:amidase [Devosia beringensis]|uniref:amidase n=1 Tax=Devosia beringensis TaxID=2657486 RepID=UPI001E5BFB69|nr:amidase [Devosia beringensis]
MSPLPPDGIAALRAQLEAAGISLSAAETDSVATLADWLHDGLARLDTDAHEAAPELIVPALDADTLLDSDLFAQSQALRDGSITAVALTRAYLARITLREPAFRAFYAISDTRALADAAQADADFVAGLDRGPLQGIPVGIKDMIDVAGVATTANAPGRAEAIAERDAVAVARLAEAGAVLIGKTATYEWGTVGPDSRGLFPPARNPWSLEHITGGSSSGNGAAIAGGMLRVALGGDTGGSLRGPAFYCGVVGLKPTFGSVPVDGALTMSPSMDHVGPMAASVAEAAVMLDAIADTGAAPAAAAWLGRPVTGLRIGYARNWFAHDSQIMPAVLAAMDAAASTLSQLGAAIEEIELPDYAAIEVAAAAILHKESFDYHAAALRDHPEAYGRRAFLSLVTGVAISDGELVASRQAGRAFSAAVDQLLGQHDALLTVGALTTALLAAPFEEEAVWTPMRTIGFNVSGHPVLAMPIGLHEGLPIGMQLIGKHHDEARIVQIGHAFERATDHAVQRPPNLT